MSAIVGHGLALLVLLVIAALIWSILRLPRPRVCQRCGERPWRACLEIDCPLYDDAEKPR